MKLKNISLTPSLFCVFLQPLDFERKRQYSLRVQVENVHINPRFFSVGPFRDEANVKITVEDVDEPPVFERASYVMEVKEDAARNTTIGSVSASDPDDKSSLIRYRRSIMCFTLQLHNFRKKPQNIEKLKHHLLYTLSSRTFNRQHL